MRKKYLDNIRWITVILVVIYHVLYMYNAEGIPGTLGRITDLPVQYYDMYQYFVYPWFMFVLFIVSGISARSYLTLHSEREFLRTRTEKLLVPSTIGLFAFHFIQGMVSAKIAGGFESLMQVPAVIRYLIIVVSGTGVLWFIQVLWVYSLLLVPIRKIEKDRLWKAGSRTGIVLLTAMAVPVWAAAQILNTPIIAVYRFGFYAAAFFLGYFVFSHEEVIDRLRKHFGWLLMAALVLGISFCVINFGKNYADAPVNRTFLFTAYAWFASLAILGGAAGYLDFETPFTRWMAGHSFGLYVFHYLGISTVALLIGRSGIFPPALVYACSLAAGFAAGYILYEVISRIPVYRWAVLGIRRTRSAR